MSNAGPVVDEKIGQLSAKRVLRKEKLIELEESVVRHGSQKPLTVWKEQNVLLDGHVRLELCLTHNITYETVSISLRDHTAARNWEIQDLLRRDDLNVYQEFELLFGALKTAQRNRKKSPREVPGPAGDNPSPTDQDFRGCLMKPLEISRDILLKMELIADYAPEAVKADVRRGAISVDEAYEVASSVALGRDPIRAASIPPRSGRRRPRRPKPSLAKLQRKAQAFVLEMQSYGNRVVRGETVASPDGVARRIAFRPLC